MNVRIEFKQHRRGEKYYTILPSVQNELILGVSNTNYFSFNTETFKIIKYSN